jgi:hypothetical protein
MYPFYFPIWIIRSNLDLLKPYRVIINPNSNNLFKRMEDMMRMNGRVCCGKSLTRKQGLSLLQKYYLIISQITTLRLSFSPKSK